MADGLVRRAPLTRLAPLAVVFLPGLLIVPVSIVLAGVIAIRSAGWTARAPRRPLAMLTRPSSSRPARLSTSCARTAT